MAVLSKTVKVGLKVVNGKLKFSFHPNKLDIKDIGRVVWKRAGQSKKKFEFVALTFRKNNPFSGIVVNKATNRITALDYYEAAKEHGYNVLVKDGTTYINSADCKSLGDGGGPTIRNK